MTDKLIQALNSLSAKGINSFDDLEIWKGHAVNILTRIYGDDCEQIAQVKAIQYQTYPTFGIIGEQMYGGGNNIDSCRKQAYGLIKGFIEELETFGLPDSKTSKSGHEKINITVNQNQNVRVDLNLILSSLQDELTGKQLQELQAVLDSEDEPGGKKKKIIEKLKSFGSDIASNILANILTNPQIFG